MAEIRHISTSLRFTITLEGADGESVSKTISVPKIAAGTSAEELNTLAASVGGLLEYPVARVAKYDTGLLESE